MMDTAQLIQTCLERERAAKDFRLNYDMQAERETPGHVCGNVSSARAWAMHWQGKAEAWHDAALLLGWKPEAKP